MVPTPFGAIVILLGIWCQFGGFSRTVVALFSLIIFGAASAVDLPALGGASVTPANFFLLFYVLRLVSMRGGTAAMLAELGPRRPLFPFLLLIVWIGASALFLPRLFEGQTFVFSMSRALDNDGLSPLRPSGGNISQAVYAAGGFVAAAVTAAFARRPGGRRAMLTAIMVVSGLDIAFAVLDVVTGATHTSFLLDPIHTASYAFLTTDEMGGLKRISGSFSEASSFASFSMSLLAVNFSLFVMKVRPRFFGTTSLLLTLFITLSTSSSGYVSLAVFFGFFFVYAFATGILLRRRRAIVVALATLAAGVVTVSIVVLFLPTVAATAQDVISSSLLSKSTSDSAIERGSWNTQALQVFSDTHWLGGGIGVTRASNYALVLLSNLGLPGFALFALLIASVALRRLLPSLSDEDRKVVWAARIGLLMTLVPSLLVGTVFDLGTFFWCLVGLAASGSSGKSRVPAAERLVASAGRMDGHRLPPAMRW